MDRSRFLPDDDTRQRKKEKAKKREKCRKEFFSVIWLVLLLGALICHLWAYAISEKWVVTKDRAEEQRKVGLLQNYSKHDSWFAAVILLGISLASVCVAFVTGCIFYFARVERAARARHTCLKVAKASSFFAGICMLIGLIILPIGFESKELLPCGFGKTNEVAFHLCNPWTAGLAIYLMVVTQILLTLAVCFSACVLSQIDEDRKEKEKRKRQGKGDEWFDKYGTAPLISETGMDDDKGGAGHNQDPHLLDEVMVGDDMENLHMPGYLDLGDQQQQQQHRASKAAFDQGYLDYVQEQHADTTADEGDPGYLEFGDDGVLRDTSVQHVENMYLEFDQHASTGKAIQQKGVDDDAGAGYLDFEEDTMVLSTAAAGKQPSDEAADAAYLDFEQDDSQSQTQPQQQQEEDTADDAYLDFEQDDSQSQTQPQQQQEEEEDTADAAYLDFEQDDSQSQTQPQQQQEEEEDTADAAYLDFDQDDSQSQTQPQQQQEEDTADDAYLDFEQDDSQSQTQPQQQQEEEEDTADAAYLDFEQDDGESQTQPQQQQEAEEDTADAAYLDFEQDDGQSQTQPQQQQEEEEEATNGEYLDFDQGVEDQQQATGDDATADEVHLDFGQAGDDNLLQQGQGQAKQQQQQQQQQQAVPSFMANAATTGTGDGPNLEELYGEVDEDVLDLDAYDPDADDEVMDLDAVDDSPGNGDNDGDDMYF